jgi:multiple sugar transport system permease protein
VLAGPAWSRFLAARQAPATPLTERMPEEGVVAGLWGVFVQKDCPLEALRLLRPEDPWRTLLRQRYATLAAVNTAWGTTYADWEEVRIPWAVFKYDCFLREKDGLRGRYLRHNFTTVFAFIAIHGKALRVTLIYILLSVVAALTVNPLAAYAMSRFRLKESHHILIFLLTTMAFPGEVLMIPNFLLIKSFPYLQILAVVVCLVVFFILVRLLGRRLPFLVSATAGLATVVVVAGWVVPHAARRLGIADSVSLMNTFWALVLPGLANGYGIFLLKGFFDSLPPELYEAGLIDGASELQMFRKITLPMSKPILAVIALGAFSGAYGAFMHAFLICQDPKMWTLMVFLYEFQQLHTVPLVMASLLVAAIPTLLVFVFCQNIILRGIVIPTYK